MLDCENKEIKVGHIVVVNYYSGGVALAKVIGFTAKKISLIFNDWPHGTPFLKFPHQICVLR